VRKNSENRGQSRLSASFDLARLPRPPDLLRTDRPPELGFDLSAKAVRAVGMLALQMQTDGFQFLRGYRAHNQGTVAPLAFTRIGTGNRGQSRMALT
jgi:hypothetical protein